MNLVGFSAMRKLTLVSDQPNAHSDQSESGKRFNEACGIPQVSL